MFKSRFCEINTLRSLKKEIYDIKICQKFWDYSLNYILEKDTVYKYRPIQNSPRKNPSNSISKS